MCVSFIVHDLSHDILRVVADVCRLTWEQANALTLSANSVNRAHLKVDLVC